MKKFIVTVKEVHCYDVTVEADNPEEARMQVSEMLQENDLSDESGIEYSHTLDPETWGVTWTVEEN